MMARVNGTSIAYTDEGRGFPLLFLGGFPFTRDAWSKQVEAFKSQFRVIAPDLRGLGEGEASIGPTSLRHLSKELHSLMEYLVTGPVVLAGQAMGGLLALTYAHAFPRGVRGLVLVGMKAGWTLPATAAQVALESGTEMDIVEPRLSGKPGVENNRGLTAVEQLLGTLRVPTLVIAGSEDPSIPSGESLALAHPIPGAQFNLIPHAGQYAAFEQADAFNQIVKTWLAWGSQGRKIALTVTQTSELPDSIWEAP